MSTTITGLPNATTPLSGTERVPMDQAGATKDATTQDIANLAPGTDLTYTAATRTLASSTGSDAVLPLATQSDAGLQSAADKAKLDGITVDRAKLTVADVRNTSGAQIPKGAPVYVVSSSGTTITVALADASVEATAANTLGLALAAIDHNSDGLVVTEGPLTGVNTQALTEGALVFLSETTGGLTTTRPTQPAHGVVIGWCVKQAAGTAGILYVKVDNGQELDELHDVLITNPATGQVLRRAANGLWVNHTLTAGDADADPAGTASSAIAAHVAAADPHPGYLTPAEATAAYAGINDVRFHDAVTLGASVADVLDLTGQVLGADDPGADRILFWDDSEGKLRHLTVGSNLTISGTTINAAGGGGASFNGYAVGNWIAPVDGALGAGSQSATADRICLIPCMVKRSITVSELGGRVATAVAASTVQLAIYASSNGLPTGLPLASTGDLSSATATNVTTAVTPFNMTAGDLYWMGVSASSPSSAMVAPATTSISSASLIGAPNIGDFLTNNTVFAFARLFSATYGTWPDLTGQTTTISPSTRGAVVFLKVSAFL